MAGRAPRVSAAKSASNERDPLVDMLERCFNIRTTPQELDAPTSGLIVSVLHEALIPFGLNAETMGAPLFLLPPETSYLENTVPVLHYLKLMQALFHPLGIADIGLSDLMNPKPKRTRKLLKILVNSWLRMTATYTKYKEKEKKQLQAKDEANKTAIALLTKTEEANKLAGLLGKVSEEAEQIEKELVACEQSLAAYSERKAAIMSDYQMLKTTLYASTEAIKRAELDIVVLKEAIEEKRAAVCRDPIARKESIAADTETLTGLTSAIEDLQTKLSAIEKKLSLVPEMSDAYNKILSTTDKFEAKIAELTDLQEIKEAQEKKRVEAEHAKHMLQKKLELMGGEEEHLQRRKSVGQPQDAALQSREQRNKEARAQLKELTEDYKAAVAVKDPEVAEIEAATLRVCEEIDKVRKEHREYIFTNEETMQLLREKMEEVANRVQEVFNAEKLLSLAAKARDCVEEAEGNPGDRAAP